MLIHYIYKLFLDILILMFKNVKINLFKINIKENHLIMNVLKIGLII